MVSLRPLCLAGLGLLSIMGSALPAPGSAGASVTEVPLAATAPSRHGLTTPFGGPASDGSYSRNGNEKPAPPTVTYGLPLALGSRGIPDIIGINPAPGTPLSTTPTITLTFGGRLPAQANLVILLSEAGKEAALLGPVVQGNTATVAVDPMWPLAPGPCTLKVVATDNAGGDVYYQGTYIVHATAPAGGTLPGTCGSFHATTFTGWFPKVVGICPAPGSRISTASTFTVTFPAVLPADMQVQISLFPSDQSGNPTGPSLALSAPVVKKNVITVKVAASPPLQPGDYLLEVVLGSATSGLAEYRGAYKVS